VAKAAVSWLRKVLDWDESQDPTQAPNNRPAERPWRMLNRRDRELLDAIADGTWVHEEKLREQLHRGRLSFFFTTLRMVEAGWIEARQVDDSFFKSEYRLSPKAW
jgi:hypothetical protein